MMGFLTGVALNIVLGQLPDLAGVDASGSFATSRAVDVVLHPTEIIVESLLTGAVAIATVSDVGAIHSGFPLPELPDLSTFSVEILFGAVAVTAIVLVQGAGVRESLPGRARWDANRDFLAQGVGNVASGLFQGQPVGGSVGQSALNRSAGARTRWARRSSRGSG